MRTARLPLPIALAALAALLSLGCSSEEQAPPSAAQAPPRSAYVDSAACAECHADQAKLWTGSHHDLAMQPATPETVLGDFDDATFEHFGVTSRFFRKDGRFFVNTQGPDGEFGDFEIRWTFGVEPLQQYLIELDHGRVQAFSVLWDVERKRWYHLYPDEPIPPRDALHWTGLYQRWNVMCADCHSTDVRKGYDLQTNSYETSWHEIDVGCQTCHGPGAEHVEWARAGASAPGPPPDVERMGLATALSRSVPAPLIEACAPCHSRRLALTPKPVPGEPYLDHFSPARLVQGLYHADGQILEEVYVHGSFLQSKMYQRGVSCSDCHDSHSLRLLAPGNGVCLQCHTPLAPTDRFPTLQKRDYDSKSHHFHEPGTEGAKCVNCHMPDRVYMGIDARRDHSLRTPRPDLSMVLGTPNACNECHADKTARWASDALDGWYGAKRQPSFAVAFERARYGDPSAANELMSLASNKELPGIVRSTAIEQLGAYEEREIRQTSLALAQLTLNDEDPLVRAAAVALLDFADFPAKTRPQLMGQLLNDPLRSVRIQAARVLAELDPADVDEKLRASFERASEEYRASQAANEDMPWAHLNLAVMYQARKELVLAEREYRHALRLDPTFLPAYFNFSTLLNELGRNREAEELLRAALERYPAEGQLHYSLGLLLAEMSRMDEAADALVRAAEALPGAARIAYNAGLALQNLNRLDEAETMLVAAARRGPEDPDIQNAVALFFVGQERWSEALPFAAKLTELAPESEGAQKMLADVRAKLKAPGKQP